MNSTPEHLDAKATASVFAGVMAIVLAIIYVVARIGFDQYPLLVVQVMSLSLLFVCFPTAYLLLAPKFRITPGSSWFTSDVAIGVAVLGLVLLAAFLPPMIRGVLVLLFAATGLACFGFVFITWIRQGNRRQSILFLLLIVVFTVWIAGRWMAWRVGYQNPLFEEKMVLKAVYHDPLIHASVSSMIQTYGIPGTGLDGIPYLPYHTGSHWFMAQLSNLLDTYPLRLYQLGFPLIFYPLFFSGLLTFAINLRDILSPLQREKAWNLQGDKFFWLIFFLANGWFIPLSIKEMVAMYDSHLASESYMLSLAWMFIMFSLNIAFFKTTQQRSSHLMKGNLIFLLLLPFLFSILGFLKIAVMLLCFVASGYVFIKLKYYRYWTHIVSFLLIAIACVATYRATNYPYGSSLAIVPFHFIRVYAARAMPLFFILYFVMSWLFIFWRLRQLNIKTIRDLKEAWKNNTILDLEILAIFCVVGMAPGLVFAIPGGSAGYFSDVQQWVASGFLLGFLGVLTQIWFQAEKTRKTWSIWNIQVAHLLLAGLVSMPIISFMGDGVARPMYRSLRDNIHVRINIMSSGNPEVQASLLRGETWYRKLLLSTPYQEILEKQEAYQVIATLGKLREMPLGEKRQTLLYIPYTNASYWNHPATATHCYDRPFLAPAVTGIAMIEGLPPPNCDYPPYYGYSVYTRNNASTTRSIADLCTRAQQMGFSQIVEMEDAQTLEYHVCKAAIVMPLQK